jgi:hypothetical protein
VESESICKSNEQIEKMKHSQLQAIFSPQMVKKASRIEQNEDFRLVHYTSAEAALKILESEEVWLRNSLCMNDFSEI